MGNAETMKKVAALDAAYEASLYPKGVITTFLDLARGDAEWLNSFDDGDFDEAVLHSGAGASQRAEYEAFRAEFFATDWAALWDEFKADFSDEDDDGAREFEFNRFAAQPYRMDGEVLMTECEGEIESVADVIDAIVMQTRDAESLERDVAAALDAWGLDFDREAAREAARVAAMAYRMAEIGA